MNYSSVKALVTSFKRGTIHTIQYERPLKTKKNITDTITKLETVQVSFGVDYNNKKSVIEARSNGELPATNQGLAPSLDWDIFPYIIKNNKTGRFQLRCNGLKTNKHEIRYFRNGQPVSASDIINDCYTNEVHINLPDPKSTFNLDIDKLISLC